MKILLIDTETSGLFNYRDRADAEGQPRMIQLAAALIDDAEPSSNEFCDIPIRPDGWQMDDALAEKLGHSMTNAWLLEHGRPVSEAIEKYEAFHTACDLIAGFNIPFDQKMMRAELRRAGRPDRYAEKPEFCIMRAMSPLAKVPKARGGGFKLPKLEEAYQFAFGEPMQGAHNAYGDVVAAARLFGWLRRNGHDTTGTIPPKKLEGEEDDSRRADPVRAAG